MIGMVEWRFGVVGMVYFGLQHLGGGELMFFGSNLATDSLASSAAQRLCAAPLKRINFSWDQLL